MSNLRMSEAPAATTESVVEQRERLVADTHEWLGRTAALVDVIRTEFPYSRIGHQDLVWSSRPKRIKSRMFTTPRIVLPAQEVASLSGNSMGMRRLAASITMLYDYPASEERGIRSTLPAGETPVPDEVHLGYPYPLALDADPDTGPGAPKFYQYDDDISVSGKPLRMYAAYADTLAAYLPLRPLMKPGDDELTDYATFVAYPPEAIAQRPEAVAFHQARLDKFVASFRRISVALEDQTLNPR